MEVDTEILGDSAKNALKVFLNSIGPALLRFESFPDWLDGESFDEVLSRFVSIAEIPLLFVRYDQSTNGNLSVKLFIESFKVLCLCTQLFPFAWIAISWAPVRNRQPLL